WSAGSGGDADAGPRGVGVAKRVPDLVRVVGLDVGAGVPGPGDNLVLSRGKVERPAPQPPGPGADLPVEICLLPGGASVERDVDPGDSAAVPGDGVSADFGRAGRQRLVRRGSENGRVNWHCPQGQSVAGAGPGRVRVGGEQSVVNGLEVVARGTVLRG